MPKILVVDDEELIRKLVRKYAEFDGYEVDEASDGMDAVELCRKNNYDLLIIDVMMPVLDGFSAVSKIREFSEVPVIMLSARGEEYDRIHGFESGVDDYVVKPFSPKELMMRVSAVLRRLGEPAPTKQEEEREVYQLEDLKVDFTARLVYIGEEKISLSPKEYDLLFYLIRHKNIALSREQLITDVWGYDFYGDDRTLDTHVKLLRKSLGKYKRHLVTVRNVGYRWDE